MRRARHDWRVHDWTSNAGRRRQQAQPAAARRRPGAARHARGRKRRPGLRRPALRHRTGAARTGRRGCAAPLRRHARRSRRLPRVARAASGGAAPRTGADRVALPAPRSPHERARAHRPGCGLRARGLPQRDRLALRPGRPRAGQCLRAQARRAAVLRARAGQHVPPAARRAHARDGRQVRPQRRARPLPERPRAALLPQGRQAVRLGLGHPEHRPDRRGAHGVPDPEAAGAAGARDRGDNRCRARS